MLLQGLSAAGLDHIVPQDLRLLVHTEANYATSREASNQGPCLPFLFSYRREYELRGPVAPLEIFTAVTPYAVDPGARPVAKNLREHVLATDVEEIVEAIGAVVGAGGVGGAVVINPIGLA